MMLYNQHKPRLSPLIEVIEPTPPLCRSAPIFSMTTLNDSDFNLSDLTSEASDATLDDRSFDPRQMKSGSSVNNLYSLPQPEKKHSRVKLINNVNSYL